jgi:hypothetical protein
MHTPSNDAETENEEGQDGSPSLPECLVDNGDGSFTLTLQTPIKVNGETTTCLTLRRVLAKHLMMLDDVRGEMAKAARLVSLSAGIPFTAAQQLGADDLADAGTVINDFLQKPRLAGAKGRR